MAAAQVAIALVSLWLAIVLLYGAYTFYYYAHHSTPALLNAVLAVVYLVAGVAGFQIAAGLLALDRKALSRASQLTWLLLAIIALAMLVWEPTLFELIAIVLYCSVIYAMRRPGVRAAFGYSKPRR